ncbi:MAG: thiamine diphosphokinase [Rubrobacteraceae bacterium]
MRAAIFLNGVPDSPDLLQSVAGHADLVIAADGGARHALEAGVVPDLVVGDMDSLGEAWMRQVEECGTLLDLHPARKDKMDGHLAVLAARNRGADEADLLCAFGGLHSAIFAIPHILLIAEQSSIQTQAVADWGQVFVFNTGSRIVAGEPGDSVSIFPFAGTAAGVTLEGFVYPLKNARMDAGDTLGFHNELAAFEALVSVETGTLLVIHEKVSG